MPGAVFRKNGNTDAAPEARTRSPPLDEALRRVAAVRINGRSAQLLEDTDWTMTCHELAERIAAKQPQLAPADVARLCLLIFSHCDDPGELAEEAALMRYWNDVSFRLEAASDQHAAVADELASLCFTGPLRTSTLHVETLLRAVKVQSQVLQLYTGQPAPT